MGPDKERRRGRRGSEDLKPGGMWRKRFSCSRHATNVCVNLQTPPPTAASDRRANPAPPKTARRLCLAKHCLGASCSTKHCQLSSQTLPWCQLFNQSLSTVRPNTALVPAVQAKAFNCSAKYCLGATCSSKHCQLFSRIPL